MGEDKYLRMQSRQGLSSNNQAGANGQGYPQSSFNCESYSVRGSHLGVTAAPGPKKELSTPVMTGYSFLGR